MDDAHFTPLESLTRDQLELRLVAGLLGPGIHGPAGRELLSTITVELSDPALSRLVAFVEAPAVTEARLRARLLMETAPHAFVTETTTVEGETR